MSEESYSPSSTPSPNHFETQNSTFKQEFQPETEQENPVLKAYLQQQQICGNQQNGTENFYQNYYNYGHFYGNYGQNPYQNWYGNHYNYMMQNYQENLANFHQYQNLTNPEIVGPKVEEMPNFGAQTQEIQQIQVPTPLPTQQITLKKPRVTFNSKQVVRLEQEFSRQR